MNKREAFQLPRYAIISVVVGYLIFIALLLVLF
jgi:hypothetical protein